MLFSDISAGILSAAPDTSKAPIAILQMGGVTMPYGMVEINEGHQNSRLQVDVSLDGTQHVSGTLNGIGSYRMQFSDCPAIFTKEDIEKNTTSRWPVVTLAGIVGGPLWGPAAAWAAYEYTKELKIAPAMFTQYLKAESLKDRAIEVQLYSRNNLSVNGGASASSSVKRVLKDEKTLIATFRGVALNASFQFDPDASRGHDLVMLKTQVDAMGFWKHE